MAKGPSTTHVIEIESGIGEPAFIPLTLGKELEPISVGKKGMWRLESARVRDVHAFFYFDGTQLFVRTAEDDAPTSADGEPVGTSWTQIEAPCKLEIGTARVRFRSLIAPPQASQPPKRRTPAPPIVQLPDGAMPVSFPKEASSLRLRPEGEERRGRPARPFPPGDLASPREPGEDTRVKPFDAPPRSTGEQEVPRFAQTAGMPAVQQDPVPHVRRSTGPMMQADPMVTGPSMPAGHHMLVTGPMMPPGMNPMLTGSGAYAPHVAQVTGPHAPASYPYAPQQVTGPPPPVAAPPATRSPGFGARFRELSGPKKILIVLAPFCLLASGYLILFDEEPAPPQHVDAGVKAAVSAGPAVPSCPPGFVPYTQPINGTIPCVPATASAPPPPPPPPVVSAKPSASVPVATKPPQEPAPATSTKTLERLAVDAVAQNDYPRAAKLYEQLQQQNPTNRVYAEAARILRAKADAGAP